VLIEGLKPNTSYKFTVTAVNANGDTSNGKSKPKDVAVNITAKTAKYAAVSKVKVSKVDSEGFVTLTWATPTKPALGAEYTAYDIVWFENKNDKIGTSIVFEGLTKTGERTWSVKIAYTALQALNKRTFAVRAIMTVDDNDLTSLDGKITITPTKLA